MSSGEWNLYALKALEEEEQKEFLALSQKNLFEPACVPTEEALLQQTRGLNHSNFQPKLSYAQLHPHLLRLPTIDECNLIAAARRRRLQLLQQGTSRSSEQKRHLKFTRVLSLSAHSLTERGSRNQKNVALSETKGKLSKISRSTQFYNVSPFYTPPPIKRCVTSHRKSFQTLQYLDKQKPDHKKEASAILKRIVGTNKSYFTYGSNSTAASVSGQRKKLHTSLVEIESYTSDENDSEETSHNTHNNLDQSDHWVKSYEDCDDSATEAGSCSVPLASDSVDAIRLMLSAATAAVAYTSKSASTVKYASKNAAANTQISISPLPTVKLDGRKTSLQTNHSKNPPTLPSPYILKSSTSAPEPTCNRVRNETTAKHIHSLTDETYINNDDSNCNNKKNIHPLVAARCLNSSHKTNLLDVSIEFNGCLQDEKKDHSIQKSTLNTSPIAQNLKLIKPASKNGLDITNFFSNKTAWMKSELNVKNKPNNHIQNLLLHTTHGDNCHDPQSMGSLPITERPKWTSFVQLHHQFIDDELEQHIKQCSCSCNHMGYGNSMDYQVIFT